MGQLTSSLKDRILGRHSISEPLPLPQLPTRPPTFVSLGMLCLQEIHCSDGQVQRNVLGGPGLWATFGARLFKTWNDSIDVGYIVVVRNDAPESLERILESWRIRIVKRSFAAFPCARAILDYRNGERFLLFSEDFLRPSVYDLEGSPLLESKSFHFVCPPREIPSNIAYLERVRALPRYKLRRPMIVWEPLTNACDKEDFQDYANVLRYVDVFSPNHHELARLTVGSENESETFSHRSIETQAREFIQSGIGCNQDGLIVVRCGEYGCFFMKDEEVKGWVGTYYNHRVVEVKDVTGAGSAFLGAFTVAFIESGDPRYSCFRGTVAASFALEQFGLPKKETDILRNDHADFIPGFRERWNGFNPFSRLGILQTHPEMFYQKEYPGEDF